MASRSALRLLRAGTVINKKSKDQEGRVIAALNLVVDRLRTEFGVSLGHERGWKLAEVVRKLEEHFPDVPFFCHSKGTSMLPDGGILSMVDSGGRPFPILIVEVKGQGTNEQRAKEGKPPQSMGNAIERLGKNVIGFRTAMLNEGIIPFVCFGDGCDFEKSSILDRVVVIAMFGRLNQVQVVPEGDKGTFNRGSFFFRHRPWTTEEMADIMYQISNRSIHYYFARYGAEQFVPSK